MDLKDLKKDSYDFNLRIKLKCNWKNYEESMIKVINEINKVNWWNVVIEEIVWKINRWITTFW